MLSAFCVPYTAVTFSVLSRFIYLPKTTTWHNSSENSFLFSTSLLWCLWTVSRRLAGSLPLLSNILITSSYCLSIVSLMSVMSEASIVRIKWRHWCWNNETIKANECIHWLWNRWKKRHTKMWIIRTNLIW